MFLTNFREQIYPVEGGGMGYCVTVYFGKQYAVRVRRNFAPPSIITEAGVVQRHAMTLSFTHWIGKDCRVGGVLTLLHNLQCVEVDPSGSRRGLQLHVFQRVNG